MSALTPVAAWSVPADEIDHIDHMGTAFYGYRAEQGALALVESLCGGPEELAARGLTLTVVDRHTHYRREQRLGAALSMSAGVTSASGCRFGVYAEISTPATQDPAALFNLEIEVQTRVGRTPAPIPDAWRDAAALRRVASPPASRPRSLPVQKAAADLCPADFECTGISSHLRRQVLAAACDADGFLRTVKPRFDAEDHIPTTGVMAQVWTYAPGYFWPMIEQRDLRLRVPRQGDVLDTYEALLGVDNRAIHSANWIFEAGTGELTAVHHMMTIFFSSRTRRSESIPLDLRDRLDRLARPGLLKAMAS